MTKDEKQEFWKYVRFGFVAVVAIGFLLVGARLILMPATTVTGIASRTLNAENVIHNYEWFHDTFAAYRSRISQIRAHDGLVRSATDNAERARREMELAAMRQSCRELATRYNANATKTNRSIFMGREAPESLNLEACG